MGKIIVTYNGGNLKSGSTTMAISLATGLSFWGNQKILLINHSLDTKMEQYMKNVDFKYTLDYLNVFQGEEEHLFVNINTKMDAVGNFEIVENFSNKQIPLRIHGFLSKMKSKYDFVIVDTTKKHLKHYKEIVDLFLPVIELDRYCMEEYLQKSSLVAPCDFYDRNQENIICIINKMHLGLRNEKCVEDILKRYHLGTYRPVVSDANIFYQTHFGCLYQYFIESVNKDDLYINDVLDICFELMKKFDTTLNMEPEKSRFGKKLKSLLGNKRGVLKA